MKLNIVCRFTGEYNPELEGVATAFSIVNDGMYLWNENQKEAYDMFYECSPDIIVCTDNGTTKALSGALEKHPETKLITLGLEIPAHSSPTKICHAGASGVNQYNLLPAANIVDYQFEPEKENYKS